ncbi:hypothetical protein [Arthrobacter sp. H-02-3]|uniref:hypothetical protein n=1 Tax=Arthrobacter sp. H-02-3 TaxID=2703675 RepID=UPI00192A3950
MFEDELPNVLGIPGVDVDKEVIATSKDESLPDGVSADLMSFCQPADGQALNAGVSADFGKQLHMHPLRTSKCSSSSDENNTGGWS